MKNFITNIAKPLIILFLLSSCNSYYRAAMKDVKRNTVSSGTFSNFEQGKTLSNKKLECYYELAKLCGSYKEDNQKLQQSKENYQALINLSSDASLKKKYAKFCKKYNVNIESFKQEIGNAQNQIEDNVFADFDKNNNLESYSAFIKQYPENRNLGKAQEKAYNIAVTKNTLEIYEKYVRLIPNHRTKEISFKAFQLAQIENTDEAYLNFIDKFKGNYAKEAEEKGLQIAKKANSFDAYLFFIKNYPGEYMEAAQEAALNLAKSKNSIVVYKEFLTKFDNYKKTQVYQLALDLANSSYSVDMYNEYVSTFPGSPLNEKAIDNRNYLIFTLFTDDQKFKDLNLNQKIISINELFLKYPVKEKYNDVVDFTKNLIPPFLDAKSFQPTYTTINNFECNNDLCNELKEEVSKKITDFSIVDNAPSVYQNFLNTRNCYYCNGNGYVKCSKCNGAQKYTCSRCDGDGYYKVGSGWGSEKHECNTCGGDGKISCDCNYGNVTCSVCHGSGKAEKLSEDLVEAMSFLKELKVKTDNFNFIEKNYINLPADLHNYIFEKFLLYSSFEAYFYMHVFNTTCESVCNITLNETNREDFLNNKWNIVQENYNKMSNIEALVSATKKSIENAAVCISSIKNPANCNYYTPLSKEYFYADLLTFIIEDKINFNKKIKPYLSIGKWRLGNSICFSPTTRTQIKGQLEMWNEDKSKAKIKVILVQGKDAAGYTFSKIKYNDEEISSGSYIWINPKEGWHNECEADYMVAKNIVK